MLDVLWLQVILVGKGNAVPLVEAVGNDFVANGFKGGVGKLLRFALDFLHRQNVNLGAGEELGDALGSCSCGVYVPGGDLHL